MDIDMKKTKLGRTQLQVTVAGLGCGGYSRLGIKKYGPVHAAGIVRNAFDSGINFFDTAAVYGTEEALGNGLAGINRDQYILSSKFWYANAQWRSHGAKPLMETLEQSLRNLNTDYIDIYNLHGVKPADYADARDIFLPVLQKARREGKIRSIGITELFDGDTSHEMLKTALPEDYFDVIMMGYNMLNPSAAHTILPIAQKNNTGVLCMFAVRTALSNPQQLMVDIGRIIERGQAGPGLIQTENALDFLLDNGVAGSITEAAYRFCRHTPGIHVTLTGTGSTEHLQDNIRAISMPPLPDAILKRLYTMFSRVDCVSGQ